MTTADSRRREKRRMDLVGTPAPELATRIVVDEFSRRETGFPAGDADNSPRSFPSASIKALICDRIFYYSQWL